MQNLVYTNTFLVQSISLWNQVFRDTGPFFFCQQNGKKPCGNKKLQSYRVTELQSISPGNEDNFIFLQKKMKKSYRVTELQSYRPPLLGIRNSKLQSYRATGTIFFPPGKKVTKLQSYRVTGHIFFSPAKKSYRVTELQATPPGNQEF